MIPRPQKRQFQTGILLLSNPNNPQMESITTNSIDISYWRHIGRDDEDVDFDVPGINVDAEHQSLAVFEPSHLGSERARRIATLLETMTPQIAALLMVS